MANNFTTFTFDSEQDAIKALESDGRKLKYIALKLWRKYLSEYKPKQYVRTRKSQRAIKLGKVKKLDENTYGIELTFENGLVYHDSVMGSGQPKGHSIMLISDGWHSKKAEEKLGRRIDRFTYFEGTGYLYKVYKEYEKYKHKGIVIDTDWNSNRVTK